MKKYKKFVPILAILLIFTGLAVLWGLGVASLITGIAMLTLSLFLIDFLND